MGVVKESEDRVKFARQRVQAKVVSPPKTEPVKKSGNVETKSRKEKS
jgi:hypothetical protein